MNTDAFYWKIIFGGARVVAFLLMIFSFVVGLGIAIRPAYQMDSGLKWGLVVLMAIIFVISALMLRAPTRKKNSEDSE